MVDSPRCSSWNHADEPLLHMFWDCSKIHNYWLGVQSWIHTNCTHCENLRLTKELTILGGTSTTVTNRIVDLFVRVAKHPIFTAKIQGTTLHLITLIMKIKSRSSAENIITL